MITYVVTDLFQSPAKVLVNTVNTVGVMGKGIALEFKRYYPEMFEQYQSFCEKGLFNVGQLWLYKTPHKWILNFPTKRDWRHKSKPEYIEEGLKKFAATYDQRGITSISFPMLGCGNGELDWDTQVRPLMENYLSRLPIDIYIHLYQKDDPFMPERKNADAIEAWLRGEPQTLAFAEFWQDLQALLVKQSDFESLTSREKFRVIFLPDNRATLFQKDELTLASISEDEWVDLWQYIRTVGFVKPAYLPFGTSQYADLIITLLSRLDYLRAVHLSTSDNRQVEIGLQVIPQPIEVPVGLFAPQPQMVERA